MSYYSEVIKDSPSSFFLIDGSIIDCSGYGTTFGIAGMATNFAQPLINGLSKSMYLDGFTDYFVSYSNTGRPGTERQPFTHEAWVMCPPAAAYLYVSTHGNTNDGIFMVGNIITFSISLPSGTAKTSYTLPVTKKVHIVGVYTGTGLQLFINGVLKSSYDLTLAQLSESIVVPTDDGYLYTLGDASHPGVINALATYKYALTQKQITDHYNAGNNSSTSDIASKLFSGNNVDISTRTANVFLTKRWTTSWNDGYSNAKVSDSISSATDPTTGLYIASTWEDSFELNSGGTSINGVQISWESAGTVLIETSLDGITWSTATNTKRVSGISAGYDPSGKILRVRASFSAGVYGEVTDLKLIGLRNLLINSLLIPVTLPTGTIVSSPKEMALQDYDTGIQFTGTVALGPDSTPAATGFNSMSYWYYCEPSATIANDFGGTVFYENAIPIASRTVNERWTFVVVTRPTLNNSVVNITGTNCKVANISFYETQLTAPQIKSIMLSYTGIPIVRGSENAVAATIIDGDAVIYKGDWSISPAG